MSDIPKAPLHHDSEIDDYDLLWGEDEEIPADAVSTKSFLNHDCITVSADYATMRLDKAASLLFPIFSRTHIEVLIQEGLLLVNGKRERKRYILRKGEVISLQAQAATKRVLPPSTLTPHPMTFDVLYEDNDIFVINKPAGLVVHPAPGNWERTFVHGFIALFPLIQQEGLNPIRPGVIHRLDKDTSGVLIAAKNAHALWHISSQFEKREVYKEYRALVHGQIPFQALNITNTIGRHPKERKKMAVIQSGGKEAKSDIYCLAKSHLASYLRVHIHTGRTHQIRVHLAHLGYPVIGDTLYTIPARTTNKLTALRHMLHCYKMSISHPKTDEQLTFIAPLASDMVECLHRANLEIDEKENLQ